MIRLVLTGILFCSGVFVLGHLPSEEEDRKELWKQFEEAQEKGLPQTAIGKLQAIYDSAVADEAYPEAIKAICRKFFVEGNVNQPQPTYVIRKLQSEIGEMPEPIQPVVKVILADWYYTYYLHNRWRFQQRTQTAQPPSEDFETWDLPRLLNEIDAILTDALADSDQLKQIPISEYDELLNKGNVSDNHRPTLYDFLAFQALAFYSLDEQIVRQQDAFSLSADSPIFASVDAFLAWKPESVDEDSFLLNAISIYQDLLRFHSDDDDRTAYLDANLHRLTFGYAQADGSEKDARYIAALQKFSDDHLRHPLSSLALAYLGGVQQTQNELVTALETARIGEARFPDSVGGRQCFNLVQQIKAKAASSTTERIWNQAGPTIDVTYRNIDKIYFRLVKFDFASWGWGNNRPEYLPYDKRRALAKRRPEIEWSVDLPKTDDYRERVEQVPVAVDVPSGAYYLLSSHRADFFEDKNNLSMTEVFVSDLSVVMRNQYGSPVIEGQVTDAITGEPVVGANVRIKAWINAGRNSRQEEVARVTTDESGMFSAKGRERSNHLIFVNKDDQSFGLVDQNYKYADRSTYTPAQRTVFFTDRSIYRPGQTIHFKGVCVFGDNKKNQYRVLPNQNVTVILRDANNQDVERRDFRSNQFGSFSGSFTAPRGRVTGQLHLVVENAPNGYASVRMEEYKRPKFFVEMDPPVKAFRLKEEVTVNGKATAYTGAPIDGAKVQWRVVRNVEYPQWWYWRCWYFPPRSSSEEIANGVSKTEIDGSFSVTFVAKPDLSVERESEPTFTYTLFADVTDTAGETRSDQQAVRVGYTSLSADLSCQDWLPSSKPVELRLRTTTLDGEGQETTGQLRVYFLKSPDKVHRAQLSGRDYLYRYFSNRLEAPADLSRINAWEKGELAWEQELTTDGSGNKVAEVELAAGAYKAIYETTDPYGQKVTAEIPFLVIEPDNKKFNVKIPSYFQAQSWECGTG